MGSFSLKFGRREEVADFSDVSLDLWACSRHLWIATLSEMLSCFIFYIAVRWWTCPLLITRGGQRCNCFRGLVKYSSKPLWFELLLQGLRFFHGFWTRSEHALAGDSQPITVRETICLSFLIYFLTHTYIHTFFCYIYIFYSDTHILLLHTYIIFRRSMYVRVKNISMWKQNVCMC